MCGLVIPIVAGVAGLSLLSGANQCGSSAEVTIPQEAGIATNSVWVPQQPQFAQAPQCAPAPQQGYSPYAQAPDQGYYSGQNSGYYGQGPGDGGMQGGIGLGPQSY